MAPNPRVIKAFTAMRALGISDEEVKPVLKGLLKVYDGSWELIEEDNYRTLVDAYFEFKEDKRVKGKRKSAISHHAGERPTQKLHLIDEGDQVSSTMDNSSQKILYLEEDKPCQSSIRDIRPKTGSQASAAGLTEVESDPNLHCMTAHDKEPIPDKALSVAHFEESIDGFNHAHIQRVIMLNDHYKKDLMKPKTEQSKLHLGPTSMSYRGSCVVSTGNHCIQSPSSQYQDLLNKDDSSACNNITASSNANISIASSPMGEVKISLNCDFALQQPNFHIPKLDAVMKFMEEKYLRSFNTVGSQQSMVKLLNDFCESYLILGMNSNWMDSNLECKNSQNLAFHPQHAIAEEKKPLYYLSDITKGSEKVKISLVDEIGNEDLPKFNYIPVNVIYQCANVNISLARIADEGCCSDCSGDCLSSSLPCACAQETGGEFAYTPQGLLKEDFLTACMSMKKTPQDHHFVYCQECPLERSKNGAPEQCKGHLVRKFIKECWRKCGCDMQCGNRVVQRGIRCKLQVFLTHEGKGWGLRTLEDLPRGYFVCEYVGEILTNMELYERIVHNNDDDRHTYPVTLDADWGSERMLKDEEALCLDATYNGNVARFINHRCFDANLIDIPVEVETPDRHYYHLAFFTIKEISAYEELTWDYGIDFDDYDHPIKAFQCCCGSVSCRDKKRKGKRKIERVHVRDSEAMPATIKPNKFLEGLGYWK